MSVLLRGCGHSWIALHFSRPDVNPSVEIMSPRYVSKCMVDELPKPSLATA